MKKLILAVVVASGLVGLASAAQATHGSWVKDLWEENAKNIGG